VFGISFDKVLVIAVLAVFLLGPERLPHYASQLAKLVRTVRQMADGAKDRLRDEMGPDFDDVDWKKLDPRQYDPRRIIREALLDNPEDDVPVVKPVSSHGPTESAFAKRQAFLADGRDAPFDNEAT
jgi:sec-independent protein translocase protein TatB